MSSPEDDSKVKLTDPEGKPPESSHDSHIVTRTHHNIQRYGEISSDNDTDDQDVTEKVSTGSHSLSSKETSPELDSIGSPGTGADDTAPLIQSADGLSRPGRLRLPQPIIVDRGQDAMQAMLDRPLQDQGSLSTEGDMIAFVADDFNRLIQLSSPLTRSTNGEGVQSPGASSTSAWSDGTSSASEWSRDYSYMSRSPSILTGSPDDIPSVDARVLLDLESHAFKVAASLKQVTEKMQRNLHKISALSYHNLEAYRDGVVNTCDSVDTSIKSMYAMMAKCEELSRTMKPIHHIHTQVEDIKRLLDLFEKEAVQSTQPK